MKRVKTIKQVGICQSLLLASLALASAGAQAAAFPKITVTGVVGDSLYNVNGYTGSIAYDPSAILGKNFTLERSSMQPVRLKPAKSSFPNYPVYSKIAGRL